MSLLDFFRPAVRKTQARYGTMAYLARDVWHGRSFREYGEWSESEVELFRKVVPPRGVAVDAGAHIGAHTVALARIVGPHGRVHAFEPQPEVDSLLAMNVIRNALWNVRVWNAALGDGTKGVMALDVPDYRRRGNFGAVELREVGLMPGQPLARVYALDSLGVTSCPEFWPGVRKVDFIKADVEGMELDVLRGAEQTIREARPVLYVESDRAESREALITAVYRLGYRLMWHLAPLYNPANFAGSRKNVFPGVVSLNLLAMPGRRVFPADPHLKPLRAVKFRADGSVAW